MKKFTFILGAVALIAMTSCKKDYTCECTTTSNMEGVAPIVQAVEFEKEKKDDAKEKCDEGDMSVELMGIVTETSCEIK